MLYIIEVNWTRRVPDPERPSRGTTTYAEFARTLTTAKRRAAEKFRRHYGQHLSVVSIAHKQDPAPVVA